jgi:hypothetical protein
MSAVAKLSADVSQQTGLFAPGQRVQYVRSSYQSMVGSIGNLLSALAECDVVDGDPNHVFAGGESRKLTPVIGGAKPDVE